MRKSLSRIGLSLALACAGVVAAVPLARVARAQESVADVEHLKSDAFKALRSGAFDRSDTLLEQAAGISHDPHLVEMSKWVDDFEQQRKQFAAERHKQYEKSVANVHLLLDHGMESYAIDEASRAYLLADDKDAFRNEPWVSKLVTDSSQSADQFEAADQWLKALRIYSDLGAIEPGSPEWKDKLKLATRRIRLLMIYAPDRLKKLQEVEAKDRLTADKLLRPTSQPSTQEVNAAAGGDDPTTNPAADSFKMDWHDMVKGVRYDMLWDALVYADKQYYRDVNYVDLIKGGVTGLRAVCTTPGLADAFPGLADEEKSKAFLAALDDADAAMSRPDADEETNASRVLETLMATDRKTVDLPESVFVSEFADGAFARLDPFSSMIWPYDVEEFNKTTQGEFGGVGIQIQSDESGGLQVVSPLEDTPAYRAGIVAGDVVTAIDGKNAKGISLDRAVKTITGVPGTTVILTIRTPEGVTKDFAIKRELIKVVSIKGYSHKPGGGWDWFVDPTSKIAYIRLTNFTKTTGDDLDRAVDDLSQQGAKGVILDLRYNPGGLLTAATEVANKFIRSGVIVSTHADRETSNPPTVANAHGNADVSDLPLAVLVNQYSASASEIVSGCLKDHQRAILVGERTFGKGSVQLLIPLENRQAYLKLTTSHYYLPNGRCIHREENSTTWGVDPDVTVEMTPEQMRNAIDARQELDVLRDPNAPAKPTTQPHKDLLANDPQLSAALLVLKMKLAGAEL